MITWWCALTQRKKTINLGSLKQKINTSLSLSLRITHKKKIKLYKRLQVRMEKFTNYIKMVEKKLYSTMEWEENSGLMDTPWSISQMEISNRRSLQVISVSDWFISIVRPKLHRRPSKTDCKYTSLQITKQKSTSQMEPKRSASQTVPLSAFFLRQAKKNRYFPMAPFSVPISWPA